MGNKNHIKKVEKVNDLYSTFKNKSLFLSCFGTTNFYFVSEEMLELMLTFLNSFYEKENTKG